MNRATQDRVLTALKQTTARIPHIAVDHGTTTEAVLAIAKLAGVKVEARR